jgi:ureidoglycolate hydrolase
MHLLITDLTPEAFAPFGTVIRQPETSAEAADAGWRWWSEAATVPPVDQPYAVGYLRLEPSPPRFDWAERHLRSTETIVPLDGACLIHVGPPDDAPAWERFAVFRVRPGEGVILNEGVWHGAPLALDRPLAALVLLRQGTGAEDVQKVVRSEGPISIAADAAARNEGK